MLFHLLASYETIPLTNEPSRFNTNGDTRIRLCYLISKEIMPVSEMVVNNGLSDVSERNEKLCINTLNASFLFEMKIK